MDSVISVLDSSLESLMGFAELLDDHPEVCVLSSVRQARTLKKQLSVFDQPPTQDTVSSPATVESQLSMSKLVDRISATMCVMPACTHSKTSCAYGLSSALGRASNSFSNCVRTPLLPSQTRCLTFGITIAAGCSTLWLLTLFVKNARESLRCVSDLWLSRDR